MITLKRWSSSLSKPKFVTAKEAISFNKSSVRDTGENHVLLSEGALQNAISRPINRYEYERIADVRSLAAATIFGISKAHAFEQGNKRTAFYSGLFFIEANGFGYHGATNGKRLADEIIKLCENAATEKQLAEFLKSEFIFHMNKGGIVRNR